MNNLCERCGKNASAAEVGWDWCATCGRTLCPSDMVKGCCGVVPAASGSTQAQAHLDEVWPTQWLQSDRDTPHDR